MKNKSKPLSKKILFFAITSFLCIVAIIVLFLFSKYNKTKESSISFGYYSFSNFEDITKSIVTDFSRNDINVEYETGILQEDYREWIYSKFLTGDEPDIFLIDSQDLSTLVSKNMLLSLDNLIDSSTTFKTENYYNNLLESCTFDGKVYALPIVVSPQLMCVNISLLENAGISLPEKDWTWGDFHQICRKLTYYNANKNYSQYGSTGYTWLQAAFSNGKQPFTKGGNESNLTDKDFINSVNYTYRLNQLNVDQIATQNDFEKGNVAFIPISTQTYLKYGTYPEKIEKEYDFDVAIITMPAGPNGDNISQEEVIYAGISPRTKNKNNSWGFLEELSTNLNLQKEIFDKRIGLPVVKGVLDQQVNQALLSFILNKGQPINKFQSYNYVLRSVEEGINDAYSSQNNITLSLKELYIKVDKELKSIQIN